MLTHSGITHRSFVNFSNDLAKHQMRTSFFFDDALLASLAGNFGLRQTIVVIYDERAEFCGWVQSGRTISDVSSHPFHHFSRQDPCSRHINQHCTRQGMTEAAGNPLLFRATDIIPSWAYGRSEYAGWLGENLGYHYSVALPFGDNGRYHLCFYKKNDQQDFTDAEMDLIGSIYSMVAHNYEAFSQRKTSRAVAEASGTVHLFADTGLLITDARCRVLSCNPLAGEYLHRLTGQADPAGAVLGFLPFVFELRGAQTRVQAKAVQGLSLGLYPFTQTDALGCRSTYYCLSLSRGEADGQDPSAASLAALTPREREIVERLAQGLTYRQIADGLFISYNTVRNHIQNIYGKTGLQNQRQLVALYTRTHRPPGAGGNPFLCT